jgi:hypothetical protein
MAYAPLVVVGCGYNSGFLHDTSTGNQISFHVEAASERYSRTVSGSSSIGAILCFIPLDEGLFKQAMQALHDEAHLKPNEALQDVRVDYDPVSYLVYCNRRLTISADVYEMIAPGGAAPTVPSPGAEAPPPRPRSPKLTYALLQEALTEIQKDRDRTNRHGIAVRILGPAQTSDSENEFWYGGVPGKSDCFALRLSIKGAEINDAPEEKCAR